MKHIVTIGEQRYRVALGPKADDGRRQVTVDGVQGVAHWHVRAGLLILSDASGLERHIQVRFSATERYEGETTTQIKAEVARAGKSLRLGATLQADLPGGEQKNRTKASGGQTVRSQITGKVLQVLVQVGDQVTSGQALLVVEAMKMENRIFSQTGGRIASLSVKAGDAVQTGKELLRIDEAK